MMIWREAWAYAPALLALSLQLSALGHALHAARLDGSSVLARLRAQPLWLLASCGLALLSAVLSVRFPGALILALVTALCGALPLLLPSPWTPSAEHPPVPSIPIGAPPRWWLRLETLLLALAAPALLLPTLRPPLAAAAALLVGATWVAGALVERSSPVSGTSSEGLWPRSVCDPALALFAILAIVSILRASAQGAEAQLLMLPKACSLLLGLAAFRLVLRAGRAPATPDGSGTALPILIFGYLLVGLAFASLGLLGGLRYVRIPAVAPWLRRLPSLIQMVPETQSGRISLNQLGGMLTLLLPTAVAVGTAPVSRCLPAWLRTFSLLAAGAFGAALAVTQSRSAWAGATISLLLLLSLRSTWGRRAVALILLAAAIAWVGWGRTALGPAIIQSITTPSGPVTPLGDLSIYDRVPIWTDALIRIGDAPWLGNGLGSFRLAGSAVPAGRSPFDVGMPHAHNALLQVGYDLGLPGLVAYMALLISSLRCAWTSRSERGLPAYLALGALAGLTGYHIYGITDALSTGSKPGLVLWILLGLVFALPRIGSSARHESAPILQPASTDNT